MIAHMPRGDEMFVTHLTWLCGDKKLVPNVLREQGKETGLSRWLVGGAGLKVLVCGAGLAWLKFPTVSKERSTQAFLSECPDMGQKEKRVG